MPITILDLALLAVMLVSGLLAMVRGFMREILSIAAWGAAALVTLYAFGKLLPTAKTYFNNDTVASIVVAPTASPEGVMLFPIKAPDLVPLMEADASLRKAKTESIESTPFFRKTLAVTRLPLPLRQLAWAIGLNIGRQRGNFFGTLLVTSVAAFGGGEVEALGPGPYIFSYDRVTDDGSIDVMVRWDHRITDAADIGTALSRLEQILNNLVADELLALAPEGQEPALHERIGSRQVGRISR